MLKIFVNTWGNYNRNGAEGGEWLTLPMEEEELDANLSRIAQKIDDNSPEWAIHDYEWDRGFYSPIGEYESISRLNDMARDLAEMDEYDLEKLDAMIEAFAYLIAKQPRIRDGSFRAYLYRSARQPVLR